MFWVSSVIQTLSLLGDGPAERVLVDVADREVLVEAAPPPGADLTHGRARGGGRTASSSRRSRRRSSVELGRRPGRPRGAASFVAPTIGAVTPGLCSSQASASCAGGTPRPAATDTPVDDVEVPSRRRASRRTRRSGARRAPLALARAVAGQEAARQRAPRDDADALVEAQRDHLPLLLAVDEVVVVLHRDEPRPAVAPPRTGPSRTARRTCCSRRCSAPCPARTTSCSASIVSSIGVRVPAVDLVEVDVVHPSRSSDASMRGRMCLRDSPRPLGPGRHRPVDLRGDDDPRRARSTCGSSRPVSSSLGRRRVHVGGVEERHAALDGAADDRLGGVLVEHPRAIGVVP